MQKSNQMNDSQLCRWFAFANAVKFAHLAQENFISKSKLLNKKLPKKMIKPFDLPWERTNLYIDEVAGDLERTLKEKGGIPFKYSLNLAEEQARIPTEIEYT